MFLGSKARRGWPSPNYDYESPYQLRSHADSEEGASIQVYMREEEPVSVGKLIQGLGVFLIARGKIIVRGAV